MPDGHFYVRMRGRIQGPYDIATLQKSVRRGTLSRFHEVSSDRVSWIVAGQFEELFPVAPIPTTNIAAKESDDSPTSTSGSADEAEGGVKSTELIPAVVRQAELVSNRCPYCDEEIPYGVLKCKHCGEWLNAHQGSDQPTAIPYARSISGEAPRSYLNSAVLTLILYFVGFWLVGVIVNSVYLSSAKNEELRTGSVPEGKGCLVALIWVFLWVPLIIGALFLVFALVAEISANGGR